MIDRLIELLKQRLEVHFSFTIGLGGKSDAPPRSKPVNEDAEALKRMLAEIPKEEKKR
jgi:hypothetical protein